MANLFSKRYGIDPYKINRIVELETTCKSDVSQPATVQVVVT